MRSVRQQGLSRRVEDGCERCRVSKRGAALQPGGQTTRARSGRSANLIPSLGAGRNTISRLERRPPCPPSSANYFSVSLPGPLTWITSSRRLPLLLHKISSRRKSHSYFHPCLEITGNRCS